ncbi:hypothetical protein C8R44DRAFT_738735 [Mycena epipterygia]|nr:hypothetical protein C8R44DRAFT_738735 [Mycena epipterygia]
MVLAVEARFAGGRRGFAVASGTGGTASVGGSKVGGGARKAAGREVANREEMIRLGDSVGRIEKMTRVGSEGSVQNNPASVTRQSRKAIARYSRASEEKEECLAAKICGSTLPQRSEYVGGVVTCKEDSMVAVRRKYVARVRPARPIHPYRIDCNFAAQQQLVRAKNAEFVAARFPTLVWFLDRTMILLGPSRYSLAH